MTSGSCRLYLITPPGMDPAAFADVLASALDAGDVACVQLRLKGVETDAVRHAAGILRPVVQQRDVAFILNDFPSLAAELGCDGVHIGQKDGTLAAARQAAGEGAIVGVTCHNSRHLAIEAAEKGADYVAFGAFFPSATKEPKTRADPGILEWWNELTTVPSVAIGGITPGNSAPLIEAGADFLAVAGGVWNHPDGPAQAVKAFNRVFSEAAESRSHLLVASRKPTC
ncbi:MAG: thiamine phosphate synthase [Rhodospirillales bacterium]|nr:thiamine phosphate synthase [Rhodospirillales bacterium]HIJ43093.1 thiamine phosphate synthase [Rhodospirillaceae bacterium]MDP7098952.1 thiamine phosphate synthase [Rhodospirillales bacterium]MDP7216496.1 thiamine phosphate synthase [Rhodospirillales bacterium]HIJ45571.1 thiamine phosphate synthase [Rhodospirillaceae bacterium]